MVYLTISTVDFAHKFSFLSLNMEKIIPIDVLQKTFELSP